MVALLRGINVGGHGKLPMADLRAIAEGLGYGDVATYIQSGNLVLSSGASASHGGPRSGGRHRGGERRRAGRHGPHAPPAGQGRAGQPVPGPRRGRGAPARRCSPTDRPRPRLAALDLGSYAPEEAIAVGRELHLLLPNGVGRSKLAVDLGRQKGAVGTMRNWRTVTAMLAMADEAAG